MLAYDREVYGLLTKELQEDPDILEATTFNINKLPESLFDNKVGVNYVLDKWNKKGKSWAYGELETKEMVISHKLIVWKFLLNVKTSTILLRFLSTFVMVLRVLPL